MESSKQLLDHAQDSIRQQIATLDGLLTGLDHDQLCWRPEPGKWSIAECIGHMNIGMGPYLKGMEREIPLALRSGSKPRPNFRSGFWGKRLPKMLEPRPSGRIKWKMKTMKTFQPTVFQNDVDAEIALFRKNLDTFSSHIESARQVDIGRIQIVSALGKIIKFRLGDAIRFVNAHNSRHLLQAENVKRLAAEANAAANLPLAQTPSPA